ncbi:thiopurine S-methyltransferase [Powellomyces hirtus]|uniref:Thiopurine S-methyltransferase n=1 Tax=Powellomyces hirtus TaxID=109895 RepID=A0A507E4X6_9FUNG|nr:thiopurine S-methyltransferase [Powellomyces hirtus]
MTTPSPASHDPVSWSTHWETSNTPWDHARAPPATVALLQSGQIPAGNGRVLVPGCGRGYDAFAAAEHLKGVTEVVGMDTAEVATEEARKVQQTVPSDSANLVTFQTGDFFTYKPPQPYDVVIDHTFLCAMPPVIRDDWARKMAEVLAVGGRLVTYMYPLASHEGGPPYALSLDLYDQLLLKYFDQVHIEDVVERFHKNKETIGEKVAVWKRKDVSV